MPEQLNIMIHEFDLSGMPYFDIEGDQMIGFYFQITDSDDQPISDMIGPYSYRKEVEKAALRAYNKKDF